MYLSPRGDLKEAANRIGFGRTVGAKSRVSDALISERLLKLKTSLFSNYPKRQRLLLLAGRITVDAREKD